MDLETDQRLVGGCMHRRKNMTASFVLGAGESEWPHRCRQQSERRGNLREVCSVLILYVGEHRAKPSG